MTHIYDYFHDAFGAEPLPSTKQCVKLKNMKKAELNFPFVFVFDCAYELTLSPLSSFSHSPSLSVFVLFIL